MWTALKGPLHKRSVNCSYVLASRSKVELGWNWKYYTKFDLHGMCAVTDVKGIWFYYISCYCPDNISSFPKLLYEYSFTNNGLLGCSLGSYEIGFIFSQINFFFCLVFSYSEFFFLSILIFLDSVLMIKLHFY